MENKRKNPIWADDYTFPDTKAARGCEVHEVTPGVINSIYGPDNKPLKVLKKNRKIPIGFKGDRS